MSKHQEERELSTFDRSDTERLLRFNVTKQRIVDLANQEFEDDWFDEAKDYSSWNRALNGKQSWVGLVDRLEAVMADQIAHPSKYLPADDPPDADQLVPWMAELHGKLNKKMDIHLNLSESPQFIKLRQIILTVLDRHPEAKADFLDEMRVLQVIDARVPA